MSTVHTISEPDRTGQYDLNIAEIRQRRGRIGTQAVTQYQIRSILEHVGIQFPESATIHEMVEGLKNDPQAQERLRNFVAHNPIRAIELPDNIIDIQDGHHRAFLLYHIGDKTVPAIVRDYTGPSLMAQTSKPTQLSGQDATVPEAAPEQPELKSFLPFDADTLAADLQAQADFIHANPHLAMGGQSTIRQMQARSVEIMADLAMLANARANISQNRQTVEASYLQHEWWQRNKDNDAQEEKYSVGEITFKRKTPGKRAFSDFSQSLDNPTLQDKLKKIAGFIEEAEQKTGVRLSKTVTIDDKAGYMLFAAVSPKTVMQLRDDGIPAYALAKDGLQHLCIGTYGWASDELAMDAVHDIILHEMGHAASANSVYLHFIEPMAYAITQFEKLNAVAHTDPDAAIAWLDKTYGEEAARFIHMMRKTTEEFYNSVEPCMGMSDHDIAEKIVENPKWMRELLSYQPRMLSWSLMDQLYKAAKEKRAEKEVPYDPKVHHLTEHPYAPLPAEMTSIAEDLAWFENKGNNIGKLYYALRRADEYLADRFAVTHSEHPEAYFRFMDIPNPVDAVIRRANGEDFVTHPTDKARVLAGVNLLAEQGRAHEITPDRAEILVEDETATPPARNASSFASKYTNGAKETSRLRFAERSKSNDSQIG